MRVVPRAQLHKSASRNLREEKAMRSFFLRLISYINRYRNDRRLRIAREAWEEERERWRHG